MNRCTAKMLLRSIRSTLGRYLAILAIVALGVGFFSGLKSSMPAMIHTADSFFREQHMYDFRLMSALGFTDRDLESAGTLKEAAAAEGACFADALAETPAGQGVWHFMSLTRKVSVPVLTEGRMPEKPWECLGDDGAFDAADLGKTVILDPDNDPETMDLFERDAFTLVGLARSPRYISGDRGSTSLGSGSVDGFVILLPEAFSSGVWHEILLWCDLPGEIYSETYGIARDRLESRVKSMLSRLGRRRYNDLWREAEEEFSDAQRQIDDGWAEYRDGEAEAEQKLSDALAELNDARRQLNAGWAEVEANQKKLEDGMAQIPAARKEIEAGRRQLADGRAQLEEGRRQLEESEEQVTMFRNLFDEAKAELAARESELRELLNSSEAALYASLAPYYEREAELQAEIFVLQNQIRTAEEAENAEELSRLRAELADAEAELADVRAERAAAEASFDPETAETVEAETVIAQIHQYADELEAQLRDAERQLADGRAELEANERELEAAEAELDAAERKLDAAERDYPQNLRRLERARDQLLSAEAELAEGWEEYNQGVEDAEAELAEGRQKLLDAETELADAKAETAEKLTLELYTLDRSSNSGYVTFENDTSIVDAIANAFPVFFVLIAALVCVTTMTRMVNEERTLIGTMKAMGYSSGAIMSKYLSYAGSSALLGCVAGYFLGTGVIPKMIWIAYSIMYTYDDLSYYFSPLMSALCLIVAVPGALLVTWMACRKELSEVPAELMRPKAPGSGKRIVLEYITPLWRRMGFLSKVTVRNAFRYKQRVAMMLLGIGGCTALMVAGFGIRDSVSDISRYQYEEIFLYDLSVTLDTEELASDAAAETLFSGRADACAMTAQEPVTAVFENREKSTRLVIGRAEDIETVISLHNDDGAVAYPGPGEAVVTRKIADRLDLRPGDRVELRLDSGKSVTVSVTAVCDNFLGHYIYVCPETAFSPRNNTALIRAAEGTDPGALAADLRGENGVTYVSESARERETMEQSMASLDLLVVLLVVCSGALAFITLYNLTNINIMERTREIATLKVLGFYPRETAAYILRENLMLSFLGACLGLGLGKVLHRFVMELVDVEYLTVYVRVLPPSYAYSFVITLIFAALTNLVMRTKLEKVDMAESLKSVE